MIEGQLCHRISFVALLRQMMSPLLQALSVAKIPRAVIRRRAPQSGPRIREI